MTQAAGDWIFERLPGYLLEVSLYDASKKEEEWNTGGEGALIEVYNKTTQEEVLRLEHYAHPFFSVRLEQGNEYIFMIRRKGYYSKRLRANVNINGCLLCMEGFGTVTPGVVDNLTDRNTAGTLSTQVGIKPMRLNEVIKIDNIYYDLGSAQLRPDAKKQLDLLAELLADNPIVVIELGSHTDSRGSATQNQELSQQRAEAVVRYLLRNPKIKAERILAKGYGESKPLNSCVDGVTCSETLHQQNRRTEFTVVDILSQDPLSDRPLRSIMQEEQMEDLLSAMEDTYFEERTTENSSLSNPSALQAFLRPEQGPLQAPSLLPTSFNGFVIELGKQKQAPNLDHPILLRFINLSLDLSQDGAYVFLLGKFKTKAEAQAILPLLQKEFPAAQILEYEQGQLKK